MFLIKAACIVTLLRLSDRLNVPGCWVYYTQKCLTWSDMYETQILKIPSVVSWNKNAVIIVNECLNL